MTIFIVDDEPKIRNGMGKLLSAHPHWQVQTFADAKARCTGCMKAQRTSSSPIFRCRTPRALT